ncbi:uncharacterized protein [Miscanthus floridulus]|uniref:uncharacterized protein isoform X2 n=1 Tax=Miscanthus floridulus TaxID=154761 RepID=UPI00345A991D
MPSTGGAGIIARVAPAAGSKRGGWIWARRDPSTGDGVMPLTLAAFWIKELSRRRRRPCPRGVGPPAPPRCSSSPTSAASSRKDSVRRPIMQTSKQGTEGKRIPACFKGHNKQRGKEVDLAKLQLEKEKLEKRQQEACDPVLETY